MRRFRKVFMRFVVLFLFFFAADPAVSDARTPFTSVTEGMRKELVQSDKNGKVTGYSVITIEKVETTPRGLLVHTHNETLDKNRQVNARMPAVNLQTLVTEDKVLILKDGMSPDTLQEYPDAEFLIEGDDPEYPCFPEVNEKMPEYNIYVSLIRQNKRSLEPRRVMTINTSDRKITGRETVTVDAGTFDCYIVEEHSSAKAIIGATNNSVVYTWYSPGIGKVKSETYDKKGKLEKSESLVSLAAPKKN